MHKNLLNGLKTPLRDRLVWCIDLLQKEFCTHSWNTNNAHKLYLGLVQKGST